MKSTTKKTSSSDVVVLVSTTANYDCYDKTSLPFGYITDPLQKLFQLHGTAYIPLHWSAET